jgi:hypothetical protein
MDLTRLKIGRTESFSSAYIKERYLSILLLGKSGTGKSTSILNWVYDDSFWNYSKIVIEPSGFLAKDCFKILKGKARYCSLETPVSLNPMLLPYDPNTISDTIAECINQVIQLTTPNDSLTARMRVMLDDKVKYCLKNNRKSLLHVRDEIAKITVGAETRDGILSRLNFILNDERMERILCEGKSVRWGEFISSGQSFLLDAFAMGREKMIFVGNIIAQGIKNYFRYERPKVYRPCAMYVDECHNFVNYNFFDILKEGRKFKLSVVLSTQDFAAIDYKLARVMLNVGNIVAYRLGAKDAQLVGNELDVSRQDLQFLEKYHCAYLTPEETGFCKAKMPPLIPRSSPAKSKPVKKKRESISSWFEIRPYEVPAA